MMLDVSVVEAYCAARRENSTLTRDFHPRIQRIAC